jgi:hypothetical protein
MTKLQVIRRAHVRAAAAELPAPDDHPKDHFESPLATTGETKGAPLSFSRTTTSGTTRRALWVFEGLLNVETFEREKFTSVDKHYQRPKAEKHDFSDWLRSELGPRCETLKLGKYDPVSRGQHVRGYFR